jgi:putative aminopeptidase FrvX
MNLKCNIKIWNILYLGFIILNNANSQSLFNDQEKRSVNGDSILQSISFLTSFDRFTSSCNYSVVNYIQNKIRHYNIDTIFLQEYRSCYLPNIIAIKYGERGNSNCLIVSAHYDTYAKNAPGADDNASGVAGVIEAIRVLIQEEKKKTIIFTFFSGEEIGQIGSKAFIQYAKSNNLNIECEINLDMISYHNPNDKELSFYVCSNTKSYYLAEEFINSSIEIAPYLTFYYDSTYVKNVNSDCNAFWAEDFPAILIIDEVNEHSINFNRNIHSCNDVINTSANNKILAASIVTIVDVFISILASQ